MQCKYPLDLNNSNPRAYAGMLRKLMPFLEEEKNKSQTQDTSAESLVARA